MPLNLVNPIARKAAAVVKALVTDSLAGEHHHFVDRLDFVGVCRISPPRARLMKWMLKSIASPDEHGRECDGQNVETADNQRGETHGEAEADDQVRSPPSTVGGTGRRQK